MPRWCDDIGSKNGRRRLKQRRTTNNWFGGSTAQTEESFPSGPIHPRIVTDELEHCPAGLNRLRCALARRSARSDAKGDAEPSAERCDAPGAHQDATRRAGLFRGGGSSRGSPVGMATRFARPARAKAHDAPLLPAPRNGSGAGGLTWPDNALTPPPGQRRRVPVGLAARRPSASSRRLGLGLGPRLRRRYWRLAAVRTNAAPVRLFKRSLSR